MFEPERLMLIASPLMKKAPAFDRAGALAQAEEDAFNKPAGHIGVPDKCKHLVMGYAAKVIRTFAEAQSIDVIVMGTVHHNRLSAWLGSTTEQVGHHMPRQPAGGQSAQYRALSTGRLQSSVVIDVSKT